MPAQESPRERQQRQYREIAHRQQELRFYNTRATPASEEEAEEAEWQDIQDDPEAAEQMRAMEQDNIAYPNGIDGSIKRYCTECRARLGPKEDKVCGECIGFAFR